MSRLSGYLTRMFFGEALALAAVVGSLLYLVQCLRVLDIISVKGQDIGTLFTQSALMLPLIGAVFLYICIGIGLARALTAMQLSGELHIIHSSRRLSALFGAVAIYALLSALFVLSLSHFGSPAALRTHDERTAGFAADLVGRALQPHRFVEVVPGVTVVIGGRKSAGEITDFFADDRRDPNSWRTYTAGSATVAIDDLGYVLQLEDGALQHMGADMRLTEIRFSRYNLALDRLTQMNSYGDNRTSAELVRLALEAGSWSASTILTLVERSGEGLRIIGMCLLVTALAAFPSGRRGGQVPLELVVLAFAFADRGFTTYAPEWLGMLRPAGGAVAMIVVGTGLLAYRLWAARLRPPQRLEIPA